MAEHNGAQTLLAVNLASLSSAENFTAIGFQQDCAFDLKNDLIDISSKTSGRRSKYLTGRLDEEVSVDFIYDITDASYLHLKQEAVAGRTIELMRMHNDTSGDDDINNYDDIESCEAVITKLSEKHPDQKTAMVSMAAKVSGAWTAV
jgi:tail tube protein